MIDVECRRTRLRHPVNKRLSDLQAGAPHRPSGGGSLNAKYDQKRLSLPIEYTGRGTGSHRVKEGFRTPGCGLDEQEVEDEDQNFVERRMPTSASTVRWSVDDGNPAAHASVRGTTGYNDWMTFWREGSGRGEPRQSPFHSGVILLARMATHKSSLHNLRTITTHSHLIKLT